MDRGASPRYLSNYRIAANPTVNIMTHKLSTAAFVLFTSVSVTQMAGAQSTPTTAPSPPSSMSTTPADNTRTNIPDAYNSAGTSDKQGNDVADLNLTKQIRKSVLADKALSNYAHNVKIVSAGGNVTLSGVVRSDDEKSAIEMKADAVAGKDHVVNKLKVAPPK
jgi:hyperosmotically inducible periplasmic protein